MADVVLFHSAQGLRRDVTAWANSLRSAGHEVRTPDLFEGATFERLEDGVAHRDSIGIPELMRRATDAVDGLPSELVYAGFSMGAPPAEILCATRPGARGALLMHGVAPVEALGVEAWPSGVPVQVHHAVGDRWVDASAVEALANLARASGSSIEVHTYPGDGHLFADPDAPEYDRDSAELMLQRELAFLESVDAARTGQNG
jgi:dienelactone hydrolase